MSGVSDSVVWGVTPGGEVTVWKGGNTWGKVPGSFKVVSCGQAGVWGVDSDNKVFYRKGTFGGRKMYVSNFPSSRIRDFKKYQPRGVRVT